MRTDNSIFAPAFSALLLVMCLFAGAVNIGHAGTYKGADDGDEDAPQVGCPCATITDCNFCCEVSNGA
jgi:hypothetical protein